MEQKTSQREIVEIVNKIKMTEEERKELLGTIAWAISEAYMSGYNKTLFRVMDHKSDVSLSNK